MIIRIMGEGQFSVADDAAERLNELDSAVESAVEADDDAAFQPALVALLGAVREQGEALGDAELVDSDLILPPADASLQEVEEMLGDEGLIPG
ncbi:PspA-associated protein PspAA [Solicola gregarius]|uniref:PspA-associated domain-containing protein n=1 Tax=Solicola gregarius TaxID=2908642 RepID=A0AA46YLB4_9ACTN|nr:hypothetical protein [Solicola gregarius]UYM05429.1 hypothetical protein L0C25_23455 [Solicola gregarius]